MIEINKNYFAVTTTHTTLIIEEDKMKGFLEAVIGAEKIDWDNLGLPKIVPLNPSDQISFKLMSNDEYTSKKLKEHLKNNPDDLNINKNI